MFILRDKETGEVGGGGNMAPVTIDQEIQSFEGGNGYPKFEGGNEGGDKGGEGITPAKQEERTAPKLDEGGDALKKLPSLEDMSKLIGDKTTAKVLGVEKKVGKKEEGKVEDKDKEKNENQETPEDRQENTESNNKSPKRELDGFGDQEKVWLQRMPYEAYQHFSRIIKDSKVKEETFKNEKKELEGKLSAAMEGKVQLPESYYDNPDAAWLMPEVREVQGQVQLASDIENHWKNQLVAVRKGKAFHNLITGKDGKIMVDGNPQEITAENQDEMEAAIQQEFQRAINQTQHFRSVLDKTIGGFKEKHQSRVSAIRALEDKVMPVFAEGNKDSEEYKIYQSVAAELPKSGITKDNPAFQLLAKSCALNYILRDFINSGMAKAKTTEAIKKDQAKAGPTGAAFNGGQVKTQSQAPTLADFEKVGLRLR